MLSKSYIDLRRGVKLYKVWMHHAWHDVSAKYKRTVLGTLWISGAMIATSIALSIVMGGIMGQDLPSVLPYIMGGILCFALPGFLLNEAPETFMSSSNIIKNHAHPFSYYIFENVARVFILFINNLVVFYITLAVLGKLTLPNWTVVPAIMLNFLNCVFWGGVVAMAAARYRDLRFLLPFMSQIIFFLTPVFWHPGNLKGWRTVILNLNPFYGLMEVIRAPLLGEMAPLIAWQLSAASLLLGALAWAVFFGVYRGKIAFWV